MKNRVANKMIYQILCIAFPTFLIAQDLDGWWKHDQTNLYLLVETTDDGIQAKRLDQDTWYNYQQFREGQFRDQEGNTYYATNDKNLEWEDVQGSKHLRFHRTEAPVDDQRISNVSDPIVETNYETRKNSYTVVHTRSLDGRWINLSTGQKISVKSKRNRIRVKANHKGWTTFTRTNRRGWMDDHGNYYEFRNGRLTYTSQNGDFMMRFVKRS